MKLSIIIPTLNEEKYLPVLLSGIKKQDFSDYEIIIADAGSKDKTLEIAKSFGCKIVKGGLPAKGRNEGAKVAQGDLFLFLDADHELPENFLEELLFDFQKRELDIASFPVYPKGNFIDKLVFKIYNFGLSLVQNFVAYAAFAAILVKKEIFKKINGFDEEIKIGEDHDFAKRAAKIGKFGLLKTKPVLTSPRRFEIDGRLKTYLKYLLAGAYMIFFGPIKSDIFKYKFEFHSQDGRKI